MGDGVAVGMLAFLRDFQNHRIYLEYFVAIDYNMATCKDGAAKRRASLQK